MSNYKAQGKVQVMPHSCVSVPHTATPPSPGPHSAFHMYLAVALRLSVPHTFALHLYLTAPRASISQYLTTLPMCYDVEVLGIDVRRSSEVKL